MGNINTGFAIKKYVDDFGNEYNNVTFKYEDSDDFEDIAKLSGFAFIKRPSQIICGNTSLFDLRKAIVTFNSGKSTEVPIPELKFVPAIIANLLKVDTVACVALDGEGWSYVPPAKVKLKQSNFATTGIKVENKPNRPRYEFTVSLDNDTDSFITVRNFQEKPKAIFDAQLACLKDSKQLKQSSICKNPEGFKLRHYTGVRRNDTSGGKVSRKVYVSSGKPEDIAKCAKDIAKAFNCLYYKGTSMSDASLFYTAA